MNIPRRRHREAAVGRRSPPSSPGSPPPAPPATCRTPSASTSPPSRRCSSSTKRSTSACRRCCSCAGCGDTTSPGSPSCSPGRTCSPTSTPNPSVGSRIDRRIPLRHHSRDRMLELLRAHHPQARRQRHRPARPDRRRVRAWVLAGLVQAAAVPGQRPQAHRAHHLRPSRSRASSPSPGPHQRSSQQAPDDAPPEAQEFRRRDVAHTNAWPDRRAQPPERMRERSSATSGRHASRHDDTGWVHPATHDPARPARQPRPGHPRRDRRRRRQASRARVGECHLLRPLVHLIHGPGRPP